MKCKHKARDDNFSFYQVIDKILSIPKIRVSGLQSALLKGVFALLKGKKFHSGGAQLKTSRVLLGSDLLTVFC